MELLYLWIENHKNIQNQGFNFSSKWKFDYQNEQLTVEERPNVIDDFFGKNIVNITALVGANGSGKTSVLEFLYENSLANNYWRFKQHKESNCIITYENLIDQDFFFLVIDLFSKPLKLNSFSFKVNKNSFSEVFNLDSDRELYPEKELPHEEINYAIYYSPFIRNKELYVEEDFFNGTNISTGKLLKHTISKKDSPYIDRVDSYQRNEFRSFIELLQSPIKKNLPFNTDNINIALRFNLPSFNSNSKTIVQTIKDRLNYLLYTDDLEVLNLIYNRHFKYIKGNPPEQEKLNLLKSITFNLLHFFASNVISHAPPHKSPKPLSSNLELYKKIKHFNQNKQNTKPNINEYINILHDYITTTITDKSVTFKEKTITHIFDFFFELIETEMAVSFNFHVSTPLPLDKIKEAFKQERIYFMLLEETFKNKLELLPRYRHTKFLYTDIDNMSSGEKHYLQFFSRFHQFSDIAMMGNTESLLILIDEGETSLHPQWQKQYIKLLKETLPLIFENTPIQIILTSHSPFIVSDLPKENIIFLDTNKNNKTIVVDGLKQKETFGANIHTLFTDAFFIDGGLMGDFAKEKINAVIKYLNEGPSIKNPIKNIEQAQQYIHLIGEPIIKRQLQKILNNRRLTKADENEKNIDEMKQTLNALKEQVRLLENQINPSNNDSDKS